MAEQKPPVTIEVLGWGPDWPPQNVIRTIQCGETFRGTLLLRNNTKAKLNVTTVEAHLLDQEAVQRYDPPIALHPNVATPVSFEVWVPANAQPGKATFEFVVNYSDGQQAAEARAHYTVEIKCP